MTLSSLSFFFFFLSPPHFIFSVLTSLPFFSSSSSFFLQNLHLSLFLAFFSPFFLFCHFLYAFSIFFFFFFPITLPRLLPLRSAVTVEFRLADEAVAMEISDSDFFFLQLWIPCDCDYG